MSRQLFSQSNKKASILVVSLWVLITLSVFATALASIVGMQMRFTSFFIRVVDMVPLVNAAYKDALGERNNEMTPSFDTLAELSVVQSKMLKANNGYKYSYEDESAKINLNTEKKEVLENLPGMDEDLAEAIVNSNRRPFKVKEEVLLVEGITSEIYSQFKKLVTVYGDGKININTASPEILKILGLEEEFINLLMRFRTEYIGVDKEKGTVDDGVFANAGGMLDALREVDDMSLRQEQDFLSLQSHLTSKSTYLKINIIPVVKGKDLDKCSIIVSTSDGKILRWEE